MTPHSLPGLERSCAAGNAIAVGPDHPGMDRIEARLFGDVYAPHRHDTYALGVTLRGVQTFHYRGTHHHSLVGNILVLHPGEQHDGGAGTEDGLLYRMLYLDPALLAQALEDDARALPFVPQPVLTDAGLWAVLLSALAPLDEPIGPLLATDVLTAVAHGLLRHAEDGERAIGHIAWRQVRLARDYLDAHAVRGVASEDLETVTGLSRYTLSRHFRAALATSPHRYLLMRRLQHARGLLETGTPLAEAAAETGFADQSHFHRHFKRTFGLTPGQWAALIRAGRG
ncbi:MAG: AraC family transcriptional regulator [Rhodospirillaceae bacterium]